MNFEKANFSTSLRAHTLYLRITIVIGSTKRKTRLKRTAITSSHNFYRIQLIFIVLIIFTIVNFVIIPIINNMSNSDCGQLEDTEDEDNVNSKPTKRRRIRGELPKQGRVKAQHRSQKHKKDWEVKPEFKGWLTGTKDPFKSKCKVCHCELTSEISTLKRHAKSAAHILNFNSVSKSLKSLDKYCGPPKDDPLEKNIKKAEIRITAFLVEHNIPFNVVEHMADLFRSCFPDSKIAEGVKMKRTKCTAINEKVIAVEEKSRLVQKLLKTPFSILTDESTDITCTKQACVVVRYFDEEEGRIRSKFWSLNDIFVGNVRSVTAENLFDDLMNCFKDYGIDEQNIIDFGSDGCNVMMGEENSSVASRMSKKFPGIIIIKCVCHSFHICASEACATLPRRAEELTRNTVNYFNRSAKLSVLLNFKIFRS